MKRRFFSCREAFSYKQSRSHILLIYKVQYKQEVYQHNLQYDAENLLLHS